MPVRIGSYSPTSESLVAAMYFLTFANIPFGRITGFSCVIDFVNTSTVYYNTAQWIPVFVSQNNQTIGGGLMYVLKGTNPNGSSPAYVMLNAPMLVNNGTVQISFLTGTNSYKSNTGQVIVEVEA